MRNHGKSTHAFPNRFTASGTTHNNNVILKLGRSFKLFGYFCVTGSSQIVEIARMLHALRIVYACADRDLANQIAAKSCSGANVGHAHPPEGLFTLAVTVDEHLLLSKNYILPRD